MKATLLAISLLLLTPDLEAQDRRGSARADRRDRGDLAQRVDRLERREDRRSRRDRRRRARRFHRSFRHHPHYGFPRYYHFRSRPYRRGFGIHFGGHGFRHHRFGRRHHFGHRFHRRRY